MKLPSYLVVSRHGVYYFRLTFAVNSTRKEKRWSLRTKNPAIAKRLSFRIAANLIFRGGTMEDEKCSMGLFTVLTSSKGFKVDMKIDQNDPADVVAAQKMIQTFFAEEARTERLTDIKEGDVTQSPPPVIEVAKDVSGTSFEVMIERYKTRNKGRVTEKTAYEYDKCQQKFIIWLNKSRGKKNNPVRSVGRIEVTDFIEAVHATGVSYKTIQQKYLAALNGFFEFVREAGQYPQGNLPTKGHKLHTKRDQKRTKSKTGWNPFSDEDLSRIFFPANYLARSKPCDYWLPLLALFTGARISELCQLKPSNILQKNGIWALAITDEDEDQTVKTEAGIREIPIHRCLINLGFLEYVKDVKKYEATIFPYMTADQFNHYSKTPGRRFGEYLDTLGINDKRKVFHSFRKTVNDRLKQNGVTEETRCQFIGHDHDTVNSGTYSKPHNLEYLSTNVASHLDFENFINFENLKCDHEQIRIETERLVKISNRGRKHRDAKQNK